MRLALRLANDGVLMHPNVTQPNDYRMWTEYETNLLKRIVMEEDENSSQLEIARRFVDESKEEKRSVTSVQHKLRRLNHDSN